MQGKSMTKTKPPICYLCSEPLDPDAFCHTLDIDDATREVHAGCCPQCNFGDIKIGQTGTFYQTGHWTGTQGTVTAIYSDGRVEVTNGNNVVVLDDINGALTNSNKANDSTLRKLLDKAEREMDDAEVEAALKRERVTQLRIQLAVTQLRIQLAVATR
jgi:hypothetical protein